MSKCIVTTAVACLALCSAGCGNTAYGPRRLVQAGMIDHGGSGTRTCPTTPPVEGSSSINLSEHFYDLACASLKQPSSVGAGRAMVEAGVLLNRVRCNDFFAQRAAHQTRERVIRGSVTPVSAVLTGIIGVTSFDTDEARQKAIQILGIGQSATVAGLELYESEFLFGASNVNAVRTLTMRALDEHAGRVLQQNNGFHGAAAHLIDHQMICTPANILELSAAAIREGRVKASTPLRPQNLTAVSDSLTIESLSRALTVSDLTPDQVGALWWLSSLVERGGTLDQAKLEDIQSRLSGLPVKLVSGSAGSLTVDTAVVTALMPLLKTLSSGATAGFQVTTRLVETEIAKAAPAALLERTKVVSFTLPPAASIGGGAVEVGIRPAG